MLPAIIFQPNDFCILTRRLKHSPLTCIHYIHTCTLVLDEVSVLLVGLIRSSADTGARQTIEVRAANQARADLHYVLIAVLV